MIQKFCRSSSDYKSKRKNKGKAPERYIDPNFLDIFIEDGDDLNGVFESDIESDNSLSDNELSDDSWDGNSFNNDDSDY